MFKDQPTIHPRLAHFKGPSQGGTLHQLLQEHLKEHGSDGLEWLIKFGATYVNKVREQNPSRVLGPDDIIRVHLEPRRYCFKPEALEGRILELNEHFAAIDKPSGLPMHSTVDNAEENLLKLLVACMGGEAHVTHRLDIPTSGVVVVARTKDYQSRFNKLIMKSGLKKRYRALTLNEPRVGFYQHWMRPELRAPKTVVNEPCEGWDECRLSVKEVSPRNISVTELNGKSVRLTAYESLIELETGRTHQIRVQLAKEGCPLLGDPDYGGGECQYLGLRATELSFHCPRFQREFQFSLPCEWPGPNPLK